MKASWRNYEMPELRRRLMLVIDTAEGVRDELKLKIASEKEAYDALPFWKRLFATDPVSTDWSNRTDDEWTLLFAKNHTADLRDLLTRLDLAFEAGAYDLTLNHKELGWLCD